MKIDDGRSYESHAFHELASSGSPELDRETEKETKCNILAETMVEQTNQSEHSFVKSELQNGDKTGGTRIEDYSYDKDVVEIKLPDTVLSSHYGNHFVKDVCIDEGVLTDQKISTEKPVDQKALLSFDPSMGGIDGDLREDIRGDSTKSSHELKSQIVILPSACAINVNTGEQYSSCKENDLEGNNNAAAFSEANDEKLSPKQLLSHDSAQGCPDDGRVITDSSKNQEPFLNGEATHQVSSNDHEHGIGVASETDNITHSDLPVESTTDESSAVMAENDVARAAIDEARSNQANNYNPFIAYGSLDETWEPNYSLPTVMDAASTVPICPIDKIDSFSDIVNRAPGGFDSVEIYEAIIEDSNKPDSGEASLGTLDVQASEDQRESITDEKRKDAALGSGICTSPSSRNAEPSEVKSENNPKHEIGSAEDINDFNPRDVVVGRKRSEDKTDNKSSALGQTESLVPPNGPDSARVIAQTGIRNPFESSFSGPSITSDPLTPSGHIPYSGNISLRSESSTTSTRSFAFPVLQTEWNSSPVKMAKADRKRDRGWSYRILCCKF